MRERIGWSINGMLVFLGDDIGLGFFLKCLLLYAKASLVIVMILDLGKEALQKYIKRLKGTLCYPLSHENHYSN